MSAEPNCPVVLLNGQKYTLLKVMLYDEDGVQEVAKLRAQVTKSVGGGGSLGVGVIGSPSWTLLGEAAAISIIGGLLSNVAQKQAVETLQTAQRKSEAVARSGVYVDFARVVNSQSPHPSVWSATVEPNSHTEHSWLQQPPAFIDRRRHVHNGDEFVNVETDSGPISIRWDQVAAYFPPEQSPDRPIETTEINFIQPKPVPWGKTTVPSTPSLQDPKSLPVGTTIYDAGGFRLAVLPDRSVLARSADGSRDISYPTVEAYRSQMNDDKPWKVLSRGW